MKLIGLLIFFLEKKFFKKKIQRTFNLSALKPINMIDIIKVIKKYYLSNSKIMIRKNIMNSYTVNISKICIQLNFFPSTTLNIIKRNLL